MQELFQEMSIKDVVVANRFVYSATWDGMADSNGFCTPRNIDMLVKRAQGGVGLLISGMAFVTLEGRAAPWQLAAYDDRFVPELAEMAQAIHDAHGKVFLQLAHAGCYAPTTLTGTEPSGPSANESDLFPYCHEMSLAEIDKVVAAFGAAAARAKKAGFDGVQFHAAHGYLLSQFLSPFFNHRSDQYGGSLENRARLLLEVVQAVRERVGKDYPVLVKINSEDFVENGLTADESLEVCALLEKAGVDAIELSGGTLYASGKYSCMRTGVAKSPVTESYYREAAARYKHRIGIPMLLVGGIRSPEVAGSIVRDGVADFISLCRPLICEPDLVGRWKAGYIKPTLCISCNGCVGPALKGNGLQCVL
jgi:2,4-dienoyl-CoA reductase-like NADH-dependent reductase (Old Yellow Enzyme family)